MWLPLIQLGIQPFRAALDEKLFLAQYFYREIQRLGFEASPPPDLSIVAFRWNPTGVSVERADRINKQILDGVRQDGRVFLSSTVLDGRFNELALEHRIQIVDLLAHKIIPADPQE